MAFAPAARRMIAISIVDEEPVFDTTFVV